MNFPEKWAWLIEIAIVILLVTVFSIAIKKIVSIIRKRTIESKGFWRKKIHRIIHLPIQIALWGFGTAFVLDLLAVHFGFDLAAKYLHPLRAAFVFAAFTWIILRWIREGFNHFAKRSEKLGVAPGTIFAISKLSSFVVVIISLLIIFQIFGFNILPLLTFGGIGVAGIAFAAQDMISNFFGGMMLHFTRIFSIGDDVIIPSKDNFQGTVSEIGWYTSVIVDYDKRPVYFPNALFSKTQVINSTRRSHRRLKGNLTLRYQDFSKTPQIVQEMKDKIASHPEVDETQSFSIQLSDFGTYGVEIYYYFLVYKMGYIKFLSIKEELLLMMEEVISKHGADFAYPTQNVNVTQFPTH